MFDMKAVTATMGAVNRTTDTHALRLPTGRMACAEFPEVLKSLRGREGDEAARMNAEEGVD